MSLIGEWQRGASDSLEVGEGVLEGRDVGDKSGSNGGSDGSRAKNVSHIAEIKGSVTSINQVLEIKKPG